MEVAVFALCIAEHQTSPKLATVLDKGLNTVPNRTLSTMGWYVGKVEAEGGGRGGAGC